MKIDDLDGCDDHDNHCILVTIASVGDSLYRRSPGDQIMYWYIAYIDINIMMYIVLYDILNRWYLVSKVTWRLGDDELAPGDSTDDWQAAQLEVFYVISFLLKYSSSISNLNLNNDFQVDGHTVRAKLTVLTFTEEQVFIK